MNIRLAVRKALQTHRNYGFLGLLRIGMRAYMPTWPDEFDRKRGTETSEQVPLWRMQIASQNSVFGFRYQPIQEAVLVAALRLIPENPAAFTFIDAGCGKGRALLIAAEYGFESVIGVEFAPELVEIAIKNLRKCGVKNGHIFESDIAEFDFPAGDDLVVFLNNPFGPPVIDTMIANLLPAGSNLYVIYARPLWAERFDRVGFLRIGSPTLHPDIFVWRRPARIGASPERAIAP